MLDIRFIRENAELVAEKSKQKGYNIDINKLLSLDKLRNEKLQTRENLKNRLNIISKNAPPSLEEIAEAQNIKEQLSKARDEFKKADIAQLSLWKEVPNIFPDDTPLGGEEANQEIKTSGEAKNGDFKDHLTWAEERGLIDFERGAKVAGNKFYYMKAGLVELELALIQFAINVVKNKGFYPMTVPHMVNDKTLEGAGFSARGQEKQIYKVEDEGLNLIATAEIPLTGFFAGEIIPAEWLPSKMAAWSPSYRAEGGAYGKHNRGLFRVHQFNKVELYVYCKPEESEQIHQELLKIEEEICESLGIPYRVVRIAAGDLGAPAYKKFDVEYWSPPDKAYRELMSCSNCTDYQARRLNIRFKNKEGKTEFVHTLNATAAATSRLMIAIIENFQEPDGTVRIPEVLQPYMQGQQTL